MKANERRRSTFNAHGPFDPRLPPPAPPPPPSFPPSFPRSAPSVVYDSVAAQPRQADRLSKWLSPRKGVGWDAGDAEGGAGPAREGVASALVLAVGNVGGGLCDASAEGVAPALVFGGNGGLCDARDIRVRGRKREVYREMLPFTVYAPPTISSPYPLEYALLSR